MSGHAILERTAAEPGEFRRGWPAVLACFCVATFAWGFGFYGQSVYFAALQQLHGWPASLVASATTTYYLTGALFLTQVHRAIGLLGARTLMMAGSVVLGAGVVGLSQSIAPWQLYLCSIVMAAGWASTTTTAIATTLAQWFDARRGLAISLALNGASTGGFVVAPLLVHFNHQIGLASAVLLLVLGALVVLLPIIVFGVGRAVSEHVVGRSRGAAMGDDTLPHFDRQSQVLRSLRFWSVSMPFALALAAQVGFIVHQVAFLLPHLGSAGTGTAIASTAIAATVGRLALAAAVDRLHQRRVSAISFASQAAGLALMLVQPEQSWALYVGSVVFGLSVGNVITLPALIVQREFSAQSFGMVVGLSSMVGQAVLSFGPTLLAVARDLSGGYAAALLLCIGLQLVASVAILVPHGFGLVSKAVSAQRTPRPAEGHRK
jgi:MFS family permease